jgi:hypothetical protein
MAYRRHRKSSSKRKSNNIIDKSVKNTLSFAKNTSNKILPKVKSSIKNVGSTVVKTGKQSIPFLQRTSRKFLGMFSNKSKKHRRR